MGKKKANEIKVGDKVVIGGETLVVDVVENSDIGKQGVAKTRIVAKKANGESVTMIRPSDYPFTCE